MKKIYDGFVQSIQEGQIYKVANFKVNNYVGDEINRTVRNEKHIYFHKDTKLEIIKQDVHNIDNYTFDLFRLEDVEKFLTDNHFLIGKYIISIFQF